MGKENRLSLSYNFRLWGQLLRIYPRTSEIILYACLSVNFVSFLLSPVEPPFDEIPLAVRVIAGTAATFGTLVFWKLWFMLIIYEMRTGKLYPGSFFVAALVLAACFMMAFLIFAAIVSFAQGRPFPVGLLVVVPLVFFPFSAMFFWFSFYMHRASYASWPSWLPRE